MDPEVLLNEDLRLHQGGYLTTAANVCSVNAGPDSNPIVLDIDASANFGGDVEKSCSASTKLGERPINGEPTEHVSGLGDEIIVDEKITPTLAKPTDKQEIENDEDNECTLQTATSGKIIEVEEDDTIIPAMPETIENSGTKHISVLQGDQEWPLGSSSKHCPLCAGEKPSSCRIKRHIKQYHLKHSINYGSYKSLPCKLHCYKGKNQCIFCKKKSIRVG